MNNIHHVCLECDSEFNIKYDSEICEDDPHYCPFCGEYILDIESEQEDD